MNIGILSLTILALCSPGFFFRRGYYSGVFSKQYFKQNIVESVLWTIIPSIFLHLFAYLLVVQWFYSLDLHVFSILLSSNSDSDQLNIAFIKIYSYISPILFYFFFLSLFSLILGYLYKALVRRYLLDSKFKILRFQNEWHYIFSGEILGFPNIPGNPVDTNFAYIDLICTIGSETYIYCGVLMDYKLSNDNKLDSIALTQVRRRNIKDKPDYKGKNPYYFVTGEFTIFKYDEIKHLNITYYSLENQEVIEEEI